MSRAGATVPGNGARQRIFLLGGQHAVEAQQVVNLLPYDRERIGEPVASPFSAAPCGLTTDGKCNAIVILRFMEDAMQDVTLVSGFASVTVEFISVSSV